MANKLKWPHAILARFTTETFARMAALCELSKESKAAFIRVAVDREIARRERAKAKEKVK